MRAHLERLFQHVAWADGRVLRLLSDLPPDAQPEARHLFSHVLAAERVWLLRLQGEDSSTQPVWPILANEEMEGLARENLEGFARILDESGDEGLAVEVAYTNTQGTAYRTAVADILTHVALHGAYHRGQVAMAIRAAGGTPANTDFITFVREGA